VLSVRYAVKAAELIEKGMFGNMVCLSEGRMSHVSLENVIGLNKYVTPGHELIAVAKQLGISLGI